MKNWKTQKSNFGATVKIDQKAGAAPGLARKEY
jgi:hypothetical protein